LRDLSLRGKVDKDVQPGVFPIEPKKGMTGLRKVLGLRETPRTIEGVDIAHLGGRETVASLVSFIDGLPFKPGYRRYRIKTVEGVDDFASIREVISRRFRPGRTQGPGAEELVLPDILLIDGGKGQLNAALEVFRFLGKEPPCLISLAKREEEIYRPGDVEPIRLSRHAAALRLLQYVRDEAHRFAQHYHHILRRKKLEE
jgi:excinuclease ABC subunit C